MSANALKAIDTLTALLTLVQRSSETAQQVSAMIQRAQSEGRDLNDAEMGQIQDLHDEAMERWNERIRGAGA